MSAPTVNELSRRKEDCQMDTILVRAGEPRQQGGSPPFCRLLLRELEREHNVALSCFNTYKIGIITFISIKDSAYFYSVILLFYFFHARNPSRRVRLLLKTLWNIMCVLWKDAKPFWQCHKTNLVMFSKCFDIVLFFWIYLKYSNGLSIMTVIKT